MFERKGFWYRFSDEGVAEGEFSSFKAAGYLTGDPTAWYLSDPEDRPEEIDVQGHNGWLCWCRPRRSGSTSS